jgi:chromosome segregation ATPase
MGQEPSGGAVGRVLKRAGYVPVERARKLSESLARAEERIAELKQALDAAKKESQELKDRMRERLERTQQERSEAESKYQARLAKLEQRAEHEASRLRDRDQDRGARLKDLRQKLQDASDKMKWAEKSTQLGREHLMAIEVKLDIVEGAIRVLDQRTRAALSSREPARAPARLP